MNYKKKKYGLLLIITVLFISIGYALIHTTLNLNGSSKIKQARWNIYFDKVENESGVTSTETKIDSKKTTVSFDIDLEKPGDYYQFNVDTVNDGTIDAIIDSTELTGLTNTTKDIIDYTVTYADGSSVNRCDTLNVGDRKTLLVKVNHFKDIKEEELLDEAENLNLKFKINYVQTGACSREPLLEIDPNGGKYNNSRKVTKQNVTKNTSITIPEAERDGYNFINWQTSSGVDLEKDSETHLTTVNMGTTDQKIIAQWEKVPDITQKHTITIDPNGGLYNGSEDVVTYQKKMNQVVEVSTDIEREGYIFEGWTLDPVDSSFTDNVLTVGTKDVTLTADWSINEDEVVAKIGNKYYVTLQKAFNAAKPGNKIELLKDITEISTNRVVGEQEVFLDLGGHTITGTINNLDNTNLRIDNGKIQNLNVDQAPVVNSGTLTIGTNDDTVSDNSIILYGKTTGLAQNGQFYFYDGYIEGDTALRGGYNGCPNEYYVIVIWDSVLNCQKAKLSLTPEGAKVKVRSATNGVPTEPATYVFYFSLDSGIRATTNTNPDVYVVVPLLENSDNIDVEEGQILKIHLDGNTVENGSFITNNGTLTIEDTASNHGTFNVAQTIVNNNTLNLNNITLAQSSNTQNTIENHKDINVTNSTVTAKNGYALYNKNEGDLTFDSNATFTSTGKYGFYNDSTEEVNLIGGNFAGIHNKGDNLIVNGTTITNPTNNHAIYNEKGTITLKNCNATTSNKYVLDNKATVNIESGTYETTNTYTLSNNSSATLNITGGTIRSSGQTTIDSGKVNISGDNTYISNSYNGGRAIYGYGNVTINGGNISSNNGNAIYHYSGSLTINGGNITNTSSSYASVYIYDGAVTINGGNIISENNTGVYNTRTTNIKGGYIKGKTYGVYVTDYYYGKLTIGTDDNNVDPNLPERKPEIIGGTYGVYKNAGTVNFYDGIIKGKNNSVYYGSINEIADGTEIIKGTDTIDEEQYYTAYLYVQDDFLQVYGGGTYNSLKKAIGAITDTGKIIVYRDGKVSSPSTIPSSKNITLDLHGNKITSTVPITNQGTLTIIDDGEVTANGKTGKIENTVSSIIENKKTLVIDEGIFNATNGNIIHQDNYNGTITINDGTFNGGTSNSDGIYIESGNLYIEGGTYTSSAGGTIYTYSGTNTIKNATISNSSSSGCAISNNSTLTMDNVTINNTKNGIKNYNKLYLNNSTIDVTGTGIESSTGGSSYRYPVVDVTNTDITSGDVGIRTDNSASNLNFYSGSINSDTIAIYNYGSKANIYGGTIYGKTKGVYMTGGYYDTVITNIGNNTDSTVADATNPVIIGDNYGVQTDSSNAEINFYDGIIKSKNTQVSGLITTTPDGYITENGVDSLDSSYKTTYLVLQRPFIQVGDDPTNVFSSLKSAITAAGTNGSMKLVGNGLNTNTATVAATQDIKLDLNGYTITTTKTIVNNGTFTIEDKGTNGAINSSRNISVLQDNKDLTIKSGNYNMNGTFISTSDTGNTTIEGGTIIGNNNIVLSNEGTLTITGGTIDFTTSYLSSVISSSGNVKITGGTIGNTTNRVNETVRMQNYSRSITLEVDENANIIAGQGNAVGLSGNSSVTKRTTLLMKGGTLYSKSGAAVDNCTGSINMYGGVIKSDYEDAIYSRNEGIQTIYGGELIGKRYGLYASSSSTATIGTNNSEIKLTPIIKGDTYGLYNSGSTVYFYDGILKGKNNVVYYGNISATADNTVIGSGSEIDPDTGDTYYTKYLVSQEEYIINKTKSGNPRYSDLQLAITEADSGDELELYGNGTIYTSITFPDKTLKLDLNNFNISISNPIVNNGTLTIIDENTSGTKGKISTIGDFDLITNNKTLTINNISLENTHANYYIINNTESSTLNLTNADITGKYGVANNRDSILNMNNTNITSTYKEALVNSGGTVDMTGGEIKNIDGNSYYTLYSYSNNIDHQGTITIRNATITKNSNDYTGISLYWYDTLKLYNTNVNGIIGANQYSSLLYDGGTIDGRIGNSGNMSINNVTLTSSRYYGIKNQASLDKLVEVTNSNITLNGSYSELDYSGIDNSGNMNIENTNITLNDAYDNAAIYNRSSGKFSYYGGTINVSRDYSYGNVYGIYNDTSSSNNNKIRPDSVTVTGSANAYGIYNKNGTLTLLSGTVEANNATNSYGLYLTGGEVIMGTYDGSGLYSADVSVNDPVFKGIGTTGYGAYRTDGIFRFFDGKILGSTKAKVKPLGSGVEDFAPTQAEYNYVVRTLTSAATGYEYAILECLAEKGATEVDWKVNVTDDDEIKTKTFLIDKIAWTDSNNNPISQLQYGAIGNIMITIDGTSMSSNFRYRISVNMPNGSPITVTNNNHEEIMDLTQETTKDYTIALNCSSPSADYTQVDSDIPVTITIEKITE